MYIYIHLVYRYPIPSLSRRYTRPSSTSLVSLFLLESFIFFPRSILARFIARPITYHSKWRDFERHYDRLRSPPRSRCRVARRGVESGFFPDRWKVPDPIGTKIRRRWFSTVPTGLVSHERAIGFSQRTLTFFEKNFSKSIRCFMARCIYFYWRKRP